RHGHLAALSSLAHRLDVHLRRLGVRNVLAGILLADGIPARVAAREPEHVEDSAVIGHQRTRRRGSLRFTTPPRTGVPAAGAPVGVVPPPSPLVSICCSE